jgi:hypothetical protein
MRRSPTYPIDFYTPPTYPVKFLTSQPNELYLSTEGFRGIFIMATKEEKIALYKKVKELHTLLKKDFDYKTRTESSKKATYSISAVVWKRTNLNETGPGEKMERLFKNIVDAIGNNPIEGSWGLISDKIYEIGSDDYDALIELMADKSSKDEPSYQSADHETFLMLAAYFGRSQIVKDILASDSLTKNAFVSETIGERTSWSDMHEHTPHNVEWYAQQSGNPEIFADITAAKTRILGAATGVPVALGRRTPEQNPVVDDEPDVEHRDKRQKRNNNE